MNSLTVHLGNELIYFTFKSEMRRFPKLKIWSQETVSIAFHQDTEKLLTKKQTHHLILCKTTAVSFFASVLVFEMNKQEVIPVVLALELQELLLGLCLIMNFNFLH